MFPSSTLNQNKRPSGTPFSSSQQESRSSGTPFYSPQQESRSSGTQFYSPQQESRSSGTSFYSSQKVSRSSGAQFYSPQQESRSSGTQFYSPQQESRSSGTPHNSPFSSHDNSHEFGSTHHDHSQPRNTPFEPGYPKTECYSNRSFMPTQNGFHWSVNKGRNYEARYEKPDYMKGTRDPFEGLIMSGTGDRKREWDKGHLNESWNTDSNGRSSFHHEQSSDRGVEFYPNRQLLRACQNPDILKHVMTNGQQ